MRNIPSEEQQQWVSISDIMAGLMVIFMFIAVAYILEAQKTTKVVDEIAKTLNISKDSLQLMLVQVVEEHDRLKNRQDSVARILGKYRNRHKEVYHLLRDSLGADLTRWGALLDSTTLTVSFQGRKPKFYPSQATMLPEFKETLDSFIGRYLDLLVNGGYWKEIREVRIEGHAFKSRESFLTILKGSQDRARVILYRVRSHPVYKELPDTLRRELDFKMTTTGMGHTRMIDMDGRFVHHSGEEPCPVCSRRVTFSIITANEEVVMRLNKLYNND